jgi:hypothetical protein
VLETLREDAKGERLGARRGLFPALTISEDTRQIADLRNPTPVFFALELDGELHAGKSRAGV